MKQSENLTKEHLIEYFRQGEKATTTPLLIGTEHEHFLFNGGTQQRLAYEGKHGIKAILTALESDGWQPTLENQNIIGLTNTAEQASISLEPGGQIELSGAPVSTLHHTQQELYEYLKRLDHVLRSHDCYRLGVGFDPLSRRDQVDWMPKSRYRIMREHMPTKGNLGLDMMLRTCTVQVNLDYTSQADMVAKFRVAMALQPFVSALFANSHQVEGKTTPYASYRCHIWQDTDPERCGWLDFVFDSSMGYERYVDYLLTVPMYFVYRDGYINAAGQAFGDFMKGELPGYSGQYPTIDDWADHTTVAFPEVRLKRYLEMRGADCGSEAMILALPSLWVGLLYDQQNLDKYHELVMSWPRDAMKELYLKVPEQGLRAEFLGKSLKAWLRPIVEDAIAGLNRRQQWDDQGRDEGVYLEPLLRLV